MFSAIARPVRRVLTALIACESNQLAAGFSLGLVILVVPQGNLIALSLCVLLFSLRCNGRTLSAPATCDGHPHSTWEALA